MNVLQYDKDGRRIPDTQAICLCHRLSPTVLDYSLQQYRTVENCALLINRPHEGRQVGAKLLLREGAGFSNKKDPPTPVTT